MLVGWSRQRHSRNHAAIAKRSRCCSHTSSEFCGLADCAFAVPRARSSSSRWRRLHRTFAGWQSWSHGLRRSRQPRALHESRVEFAAFLLNSRSSVAGVDTAAPAGARRHIAPLSRFVLASRARLIDNFHNKIGPKLTCQSRLRMSALRGKSGSGADLLPCRSLTRRSRWLGF